MYRVVAAAAAADTDVAPVLEWSTCNKHSDTVDDPHLFSNQFETETSTDTMHSLTWKQKGLRDSRFKNPGHTHTWVRLNIIIHAHMMKPSHVLDRHIGCVLFQGRSGSIRLDSNSKNSPKGRNECMSGLRHTDCKRSLEGMPEGFQLRINPFLFMYPPSLPAMSSLASLSSLPTQHQLGECTPRW